MRLTIPTLLIFAGFAGAAPVPEKPALPTGPAPQFVLAEVRDGNFLVTIQREVLVTEQRSEFVQKGDVLAEKVKLVVVKRFVTEQITLKGASTRVYDLDGMLVPATQAAERLKDATLVLLSANDKIVDPAYRAVLSRKVLILVNTEATTPPPVRRMPGPEPLPAPPGGPKDN